MSIGIAVTFAEGALLVADGRQVHPFDQGAPPDDDVDKLFAVAPGIGGIVFGVVQASEVARDLLQGLTGPRSSPEDIFRVVKLATAEGWTEFTRRLAAGVDRSQPSMQVALVVAGVGNGTPFVAGALTSEAGTSSSIAEGPGKRIVLGGEKAGALGHFDTLAQPTFKEFGESAGPRSAESDLVKALVADAKATVEFAEAGDTLVGGVVRYGLATEAEDFVSRVVAT